MTTKPKRVVPRGKHPYDTNDYIDLPPGTEFRISITYRDRITAACLDPHHCTIANAISRDADNLGIIDLGRRGVSRRFVSMLLDSTVHPWAKPNKWYRGRLTDDSAEITVELDMLGGSPAMQRKTQRSLRKMAAALPHGELSEWTEIRIVAPYASEKKGYRAGATVRGKTGKGTKPVVQGIPRRHWKPTPVSLP